MINDIMALIDESIDEWRKAAFYADEEVSELLDDLYLRWEKGGKAGIPLDYATDEEIAFLYRKALVASKSGRSMFKKFVKQIIAPKEGRSKEG